MINFFIWNTLGIQLAGFSRQLAARALPEQV